MSEKTILVVDDDREWARVLGAHLIQLGYRAEISVDAMQGTMQAGKILPDLLLLDINMPAGGGIQVLDRLRANIKTISTPVIVMTARSDKAVQNEAEKLGISGFFQKPVDLDELETKIKEILG